MCAKSDTSGRVSRRERRFQRQRKEIMDAAARLFAEKGYTAASTKDIAEAADLGESTLYGYFASKQEILRAILLALITQVEDYFQKIKQVKSREEIVDMIDNLAEILLENSSYLRAFIAEAWVNDLVLDEFFIQQFKDILIDIQTMIQRSSARGKIIPVDPVIGARIMIGSFVTAYLPYLRGREPNPSPAERRAISQIVVNTLMDGFAVRHTAQNNLGETE